MHTPMHVSVTGISHHETPVELREQIAFAPAEIAGILSGLKDHFAAAALISTCNRSELYLASSAAVNKDQSIQALAQVSHRQIPEGMSFYHYEGVGALKHLGRVAAGVDSLVVGESEVLGQVRQAFSAATAAGSANPTLARLFHTGIRIGRRARNETLIGAHGLSVAAIAVSLSRKALGDLRQKTVLIVGSGEVGQRAAAALAQNGAQRILVTTRTPARADAIAAELGAIALPFDQLPAALAEADVVISATSATAPVISRDTVAAAVARRPSRQIVMVDIAVPRDIEAAVRDLPGVHLFDIDDLEVIADRNLEARREEIAAVEEIVKQEAALFAKWLEAQAVTPTVAALRQRAEKTRRAEMERTLARLPKLSPEDQQRIEAMTKALVKRLLHDPVTRLREDGRERHIEAVRDLFKLDEEP